MSIEPLVPDLPGYSDVTLISTGSSSLVFRAVQTRLTRTVAIKVLLVDSDAATHTQYQRELETTVLLSSQPHIVGIIDTGTTSAGNPYIVMEYCPGGSYAQILKQRGPLPVDEVVDVGMKIAEALQAAHDVGVLHRDVKPSNILRSAFGPALADFGIARAPHLLSTTTSVDRMTPYHASPEAMRKDAQTAASDLYSLASTMWHLLAGRAPFEDPERTDLESLRERVLNEPPPLVPRGDIPAWLQQELFRALSKDPEQRHPNALVFSETLRQYAYRPYYDGQPGGSFPTSGPPTALPPTSAPPMPPQAYPGQPVSSQPVSAQPVPYPPQYPAQPVSSQPVPYPPPEGYPPQAPAAMPPTPMPPTAAPPTTVPPTAVPPTATTSSPPAGGWPDTPPAVVPRAPRDAFRWPSAAPTRRPDPWVEPAAPVLDPAAQEAAAASTITWHDPPKAPPAAASPELPPAPSIEPSAQPPVGPDAGPDTAPAAQPPTVPNTMPLTVPPGKLPGEPAAERGEPDGAPGPADDASSGLGDAMRAFNQVLGQTPGQRDDPAGDQPAGSAPQTDSAPQTGTAPQTGSAPQTDSAPQTGTSHQADASGSAAIESVLRHPTDLRQVLSRPTELRPSVDTPVSAPPTTPEAVSAPPAPSYPFDPVSAPPVPDDRHGPTAFGPSPAGPLSGPPLPGSSIPQGAMPDSAIPGAMPGPSMSSPAPYGQPMSSPPLPSRPLSGSPLQPMSSQPMPGQPTSGLPITGSPMSGMPMSGPPMPGQRSPYDLAGPAQHSEPYAPQPRSGPPDLQHGRPRPDLRWPGESRPRGPLLVIAAGTALVVLLVFAVIVLLHGHGGSPNTPTAAGTASSTPSGPGPSPAGGPGGGKASGSPAPGKSQATQPLPVVTEGAPTSVKLTDNRTSVTLTWKNPPGDYPLVVLGNLPNQIPSLLTKTQLAPGTTTWTQQGINASANYCYEVATIFSANGIVIAPSVPEVCTHR